MTAPSDRGSEDMSQATVIDEQSRALIDGVAATLRRFERDAAGASAEPAGAARRLETFQRALARALQAAHLETCQELSLGESG
ncbi:MAG TPA: hypothetical protein VMS74_11865 [Acidimicrobiia bacterium]|nr:hypothetical protein [Acidimicrobiia bacterium]